MAYIFVPYAAQKPFSGAFIMPESPFARLRTLLEEVSPPPRLAPIDMSLGEPQNLMPDHVAPHLSAHNPGWSKYPPAQGIEAWQKAVHQWCTKRYSLKQPSQHSRNIHLLPLGGSREGLYLACRYAVLRKRSATENPIVAFPNPTYQLYYGTAALNQADALAITPQTPAQWTQAVLKMPKQYSKHIAALFLCNPDNPTGTVFSETQLRQLLNHAETHDYMLIADECYSEIYYESPPPGLLQIIDPDNVKQKYIIANSLSKRSAAPGLRSGFLACDAESAPILLAMRNYVGSVPPIPVQQASAQLWSDHKHVQKNRRHYKKLRQIAARTLTDYPGFQLPQGGFFLHLKTPNGEGACRQLWQQAAIKTMPCAYMALPEKNATAHNYIRIAMVHNSRIFTQAMRRMAPILRQYKI